MRHGRERLDLWNLELSTEEHWNSVVNSFKLIEPIQSRLDVNRSNDEHFSHFISLLAFSLSFCCHSIYVQPILSIDENLLVFYSSICWVNLICVFRFLIEKKTSHLLWETNEHAIKRILWSKRYNRRICNRNCLNRTPLILIHGNDEYCVFCVSVVKIVLWLKYSQIFIK